jgi:hypothetical protein
MDSMGNWDLILLVVVGYLAISLLVRLMLAHRNRVARQLREQADGSGSKNLSSKHEKMAS